MKVNQKSYPRLSARTNKGDGPSLKENEVGAPSSLCPQPQVINPQKKAEASDEDTDLLTLPMDPAVSQDSAMK